MLIIVAMPYGDARHISTLVDTPCRKRLERPDDFRQAMSPRSSGCPAARASQRTLRQRVLGLFERRGLLSRETVAVMQGWGHSGGFSVHAGVRVAAQDSAGRERLL